MKPRHGAMVRRPSHLTIDIPLRWSIPVQYRVRLPTVTSEDSDDDPELHMRDFVRDGAVAPPPWNQRVRQPARKRVGAKRASRWNSQLDALDSDEEDDEEEACMNFRSMTQWSKRARTSRSSALTANMRISSGTHTCFVCTSRVRQWCCVCSQCGATTCLDCFERWRKTLDGKYSCPHCRAQGDPDFQAPVDY